MSFILAIASYLGCIFISLLIADFITGVMHWAEDTWLAPGRSALLDRYIVIDNIDHHRFPGKIRAGAYWATNRVCIALAAGAALALALCHVHAWEAYFVLALVSQSNQIHLWAHSSRAPRAVRVLQRAGVLQSAKHHAVHHKNPYASRFCTMTAYLNPLLDGIGFWRGLEALIIRCGGTVQRASAARGGF